MMGERSAVRAGDDEALGALLRGYRLAAVLPQEELAALSGLSVRTISCIETGRTMRPYRKSVLLLADALALADADRVALLDAIRHGSEGYDHADHATVTAESTPEVKGIAPVVERPAQLPPDVREFTGRADQIAWLRHLLTDREPAGPVPIATITGVGGLGKSALAIHVAHQLRDEFPDGQLFIELQGSHDRPVTSWDALARLLRHLGVTDAAMPKDDAECAAEYRARVADRRMLIILDDARDAAQVRSLLPGTASSAVLVTSRSWLADLEGGRVLALDGLDDTEALDLFASICGRDRVSAEPEATRSVLAACGGLPLAVRIAASRLVSRPGWHVGTLADRLADERRRLEELQVGDLAVRTSFQVSYATLAGLAGPDGDDVARAFRLLGLWSGPDISLYAAASLLGLDLRSAARTLEKLVDIHMLEAPAARRYRFHDLIRAFAAACARQDEVAASRDQAILRLLSWYLHTADRARAHIARTQRYYAVAIAPVEAGVVPLDFPDFDMAVDWSETEQHNLVAAVMLAARCGLDRTCMQLAERVWHGYQRSPWGAWARVLEVGAASAAKVGDHGAQAWLMNYLSNVLMYRGDIDEARANLERALPLSRAVGDLLSEATLTAHLGIVYKQMKRHDEAIAYFERSMSFDADMNPVIGGRIKMNLGMLYVEVGRLDEGTALMEQALATAGQTGDYQMESLSQSMLADGYRQMGRRDDAVRWAQSALKISRRIRDRYHEAAALSVLGQALAESGDTAAACSCLTSAYNLANDLGIPEAAQIAASLAALAAQDSRPAEAPDMRSERGVDK
jgi:tetratricopeptide (TPR) repeat protein/transcriptional regulator with XRE-family HTH domain